MYAPGTTPVKTGLYPWTPQVDNKGEGVFRMRRWMVILALMVAAAFLIGLRTGPDWVTGQTIDRPAHQVHTTR